MRSKFEIEDSNISSIKIKYNIREIKTIEELKESFSLRYNVFEKMDVIAEKYKSAYSGLELDNFDKYSIPIGCFTHKKPKKLIGHIRIITTNLKEESAKMTWEIVKNLKDDVLVRAYKAAYSQDLPIFESFQIQDIKKTLLESNKSYSEMSRLIVSEKYRGQGIGSLLIKKAIMLTASMKIDHIFLACAIEQKSFYEKFRFEVMEVDPVYYHRIGRLTYAMQRPTKIIG